MRRNDPTPSCHSPWRPESERRRRHESAHQRSQDSFQTWPQFEGKKWNILVIRRRWFKWHFGTRHFSGFLVNFLLHFLVYLHVRTWKGSLKPFDPEQRDTSKWYHCKNKTSVVTKLISSETSVGPKTPTLAELGQYSIAARGFVPFIYCKNKKPQSSRV